MNDVEARQRAAQVMGVQVDVEPEQVKKLYRQLAKEWHPDRQGGDENRFGQLSWAYSVLMKPMPTMPGRAAGPGPGWSAGGQERPAGTPVPDGPPTEPIPVFREETRTPESVPTVGVQHGLMTWVRTHVRVRLVVQALVASVALLVLMARTGLAWWSLGFAVPLVLLMLGRALYGAFGRPEVPWFDRDRKKAPRRPSGPDDTPTGPIPVVTQEMLNRR